MSTSETQSTSQKKDYAWMVILKHEASLSKLLFVFFDISSII